MFRLIILFLFLFESFIFERERLDIQIIPYPQIISINHGFYDLPNKIKVKVNSNELLPVAEKFISKNPAYKIFISNKTEDANLFLNINNDFYEAEIPEDFIDESYKLEIKENGVFISAKSIKGIFYGVISLTQLIETSKENKLPLLKIVDWPNMKFRGISDDIARGQVSKLENFYRIIDFLAEYKMNTYMIYIEDVIELKSYPSIGKNRGALTKEEIKNIVSYAKENFIDVIPIFQTLGHYENILSKEDFVDYAEFPGGATLAVTEEKTYKFLETCLKEIAELFPSEYIHIGADESWDVGLGKSKELVKATSLSEVHANHYKKVYDICTKLNKKVMMYGDIILNHPKILEKLPKDITIVDWHYRPDFFYPSTVTFSNYNFQYLVSPSVWNFLTIFPVNFNAIPNIIRLTNDGIQNNAKGMINSNWGDYGAETFKETLFYGYAWSAQCSWNYSASSIYKFHRDFCKMFYGSDDIRLQEVYETLNDPNGLTTWHEFWRHPLLPIRESSWWEVKSTPYSKIYWIESKMSKVKEQINLVRENVKKNKAQLDVLELVTDMMLYYKMKLETQIYLHAKLNLDSNEELDSLRIIQLNEFLNNIDIKTLIDKNITELKRLKKQFAENWLKFYKPENLNMIMDKFDRLISYFEETKAKTKYSLPVLKSKWIYNQLNENDFADQAVFEKNFYVNDSVISAKAQLLADSYAELYINENYIDRVFARRSGSLLVDYQRIKYFDVTKFIKKGNNSIKIIAKSWERTPKAGINFISLIKTDRETTEILSDKSWNTKILNSDEPNMKPSTELEYRMIVTEPNFFTDRTSWIER